MEYHFRQYIVWLHLEFNLAMHLIMISYMVILMVSKNNSQDNTLCVEFGNQAIFILPLNL